MRRVAVACALAVGLGLLPALPAAADVGTPGRLDVQQVALSGTGAKDRGAARTVTPGWTTDVALRSQRQMVDLTWSGAPSGAVKVRIPTGPDTWGPWQEMTSDPDEGPDTGGNGRNGVGPLYLGRSGTDQIQIRVSSGRLTDLRMDAMRWIAPTGRAASDVTRLNPDLTPSGKAGGPAGPVIHPRSQWAPGGWHPEFAGCTKAPVTMSQLRFVVIHHTDGTNNYRASDVPGILAGIYRFHTGSRGWCDIAYNFLVDRFGGIWQGRSGAIDVPIMGGHAKGFNTDSMGVALLGQFQPGASPPVAAPSSAALGAVRQLVTWKLSIHGLSPTATVRIRSNGSTRYAAGRYVNLPLIQGHIDSSMTDCPGSLVRTQMAALRAGVASDLARSASPGTWAPATTGQGYFAQVWRNSQARAATNTQAAQATSQVTRTGRPLAAVVADVLVSAGTDDRIGRIVRLYESFTGRHADTTTLVPLIAKRDQGWSTAALATELGRTPEFTSRYLAGNNGGFIAAVYRNLLGRAPSPAEVATSTKVLASGTTRAAFVASASDSQEYRNRTMQLTRVVDVWFSLLQQAPDAGSYASWPARLSNGTAPSALVALLLPRARWVTSS